jgi:hypothetical protein
VVPAAEAKISSLRAIAKQSRTGVTILDCFVAALLAMTKTGLHDFGICLLLAVLEHFFHLDMQALAERGMMALPSGKQRSRLLRRMRLDPPFLRASDNEARMESLQLWLRSMLRRSPRQPRLRPLIGLARRFFHIGDGRHVAFPG